jgi:DNA-directed RNA polymerase subunit alpha
MKYKKELLIPILYTSHKKTFLQRAEKAQVEMENKLNKTIEELDLGVRAYLCLRNENIKYLSQLVQKTEMELLQIKSFGRKSLREVKDVLLEMGLDLNLESGFSENYSKNQY